MKKILLLIFTCFTFASNAQITPGSAVYTTKTQTLTNKYISGCTANTPTVGDNDNSVATTSFVTNSYLNFYNPKNYGAIGDGTTDDATAILNAINASIAATGNVNLIFPNGTFLINSQILISNSTANVTIIGNSAILKSGVSVVGNSVLRISAANNVSIKDLHINFNLNAVAHYGLRLGDNSGGGFVNLAKIDGCSFYDFGANQRGVYVENIRYSSGVSGNFNMPSLIIDNCNFFNYLTGAGAINYTSNSLYGVGIQLAEIAEYSRISNCSFNSIAIAIYSASGANTDITGCNFLGCLPKQTTLYTYGAIYIPNTGSNNGKHNIVGCKFNHNYGYSIYVAYATAERPVTVKACQFIANATSAIYITHTGTVSARHQIHDNYFERCSQAFTNSFTNQPFGASLQPFIYLNNQLRCSIRLNTFLNDGTYGVVSVNSSDYIIVKNNNWYNITGATSLVGANNQVSDNDNL